MKRDAKKMWKLDDSRPRPYGARRNIGEPWVEMGVSRSVYYAGLRKWREEAGLPLQSRSSWANPDSQESKKPWEKLGIDRSTYFKRKKNADY